MIAFRTVLDLFLPARWSKSTHSPSIVKATFTIGPLGRSSIRRNGMCLDVIAMPPHMQDNGQGQSKGPHVSPSSNSSSLSILECGKVSHSSNDSSNKMRFLSNNINDDICVLNSCLISLIQLQVSRRVWSSIVHRNGCFVIILLHISKAKVGDGPCENPIPTHRCSSECEATHM